MTKIPPNVFQLKFTKLLNRCLCSKVNVCVWSSKRNAFVCNVFVVVRTEHLINSKSVVNFLVHHLNNLCKLLCGKNRSPAPRKTKTEDDLCAQLNAISYSLVRIVQTCSPISSTLLICFHLFIALISNGKRKIKMMFWCSSLNSYRNIKWQSEK